jgi:RNA polymerase-binding protein DksA
MTEDLRRRTEALVAAAVQEIDALERDLEAVTSASASADVDDEHDPEGATLAFERQQVAALLDQARRTATAARRALERLDHGDYGMCQTCGGPIGVARLQARPASTTCIDCARTLRP